ncbi:MAG: helix-turn-helix domain-containing protein [Anaerolineae bacterium]|nr:helix-turn-helix domain-containing protein [Anaerolineae bacterium]
MDTTEIMTAQEVADYLRLTEATVYKLAQAGEIPATKVGRAWRFRRDLIDEWFRRASGPPQVSEELVDSRPSGGGYA